MTGKIAPRRPYGLLGPRPEGWGGLRDEFEELLSNLWDARRGPQDLVLAADISETPEAVQLRMDIPGVSPENIDIQLHDQVLTVRGERKEEKEEKGKTFHRVERQVGSFARSFSLPCSVAENQVAAKYADGVLEITLPKSKEARQRKIPVQGS